VARALVESHGGDLTLQSEPGKGTRAVLELPEARPIS
jgi:signal transduction histidine kinase